MITANSKKITDLAILGGPKAFQEKKHVGSPNLGNRQDFLDRINLLLDRKWLTNDGPNVRELEEKLAGYLGVKHCIAVSNGTTGLMIALKAAGIEGEVITPSFTFIATAHALEWQGISPVFCDIDPHSCTIDPSQVESLITDKTTAIIGVHIFGKPCHTEELIHIAQKYNLKLIFDAAHGFGCSAYGQMIGSFGNAEVFSFHATKFFHTLEGGAIVTQEDDLAARIRLMRNFGFQGNDNVVSVGINGKMNDVAAAMGLTMMGSLESILEWNEKNYYTYKNGLDRVQGISFMQFNNKEKNNYQYIVIQVDEEICHISRDQLVAILNAENILARRYFYPGCHKMEPYRSMTRHQEIALPVTDVVSRQVICLPNGTAVTTRDIEQICDIIKFAVRNGTEINRSLSLQRPEAL